MAAHPATFLSILALLSTGIARGQAVDGSDILEKAPPEEKAPLQAGFVLEVFKMPSTAAYDLINQDLSGPEFHARMVEVLKAGAATLDKLIIGKALAGVSAIFQQAEDYLYPTEFDPPQIPQMLALIKPRSRPPPARSDAAGTPISPFNGGLGIISTNTPTAYQSRVLGDELKIEPSRPDEHGRLPVSYTLQTSMLTSVVYYRDQSQPVFSTKKLTGSALLKSGQPAYLGTYSLARRTGVPQEHTEEVVSLAFLTAQPDPSPPVPLKKAERPNNLRFTLEAISMEKATAHSLILEPMDDPKLYDRISTLIGNGQAKRETTLVIRGPQDMEITVENNDQHEYPTEFDPPQIPQNLILGDAELLRDLRGERQTGLGAQPPVEGGNPNGGFGLVTSLSPTAFQSASLGETVKLNASVRDGMVEAVFAITIRHLDGEVSYNGIAHPVFGRQEIASTIRTALGRPVLLGTLNKALDTGYPGTGKDDRIWLAFLRVTVR